MADWKNLSKLLSLQDRIAWLFNQEGIDLAKMDGMGEEFSIPTDIAENNDHIFIYMEIPGIDIKDINVFYKDDTIIIKGSKSSPALKENDKIIRIERFYGKFERHFEIKHPIDENSITASMEEGILTITMNKKILKRNIKIEA